MVTFTCPSCGKQRTGKRRRCYPCTVRQSPASREKIRQALKGVRHTDERRRNISEGKRQQIAADGRVFDLAAHMRTQPHPFAVPVGTERLEAKGRYVVKCEDGRWRYRARLVWEREYGPIPRGRVIHHDNEDSTDDRPENLMCLTRAEHINIHRSL